MIVQTISAPRACSGVFASLLSDAPSIPPVEATMSPNPTGRLLSAARMTLIAASAMAISACSLLAPFDSKFQCERNRDYGKCTDVKGAYNDALGNPEDPEHPIEEPGRKRSGRSRPEADPSPRFREDDAVARANINRYKAAEYREMAGLIEQPVTPVVAPPKVLRTLVVAYATPEKTLFLPRYVYFFVSEGNFVMGDYLNAEQPQDASTLYPNGQPMSFR